MTCLAQLHRLDPILIAYFITNAYVGIIQKNTAISAFETP